MCKTIHTMYENEVGLEIHFHVNQSHFHMRDFVQGLVLKQRHKLIQKWPMKLMSQISDFSWIFKLSKLQNIARQNCGPCEKKIIT